MKLSSVVAIAIAALLPQAFGSPASAADLAAGEAKYAASCASCHGPAGRGMASFPSIRGKDAEFVSSRLKTYRAGEKVGPNSLLMIPMSAELTDDEIVNLAAFISTRFK